MLDYMKIYLQTDVQLLCDVFEAFREKSLKVYHLDPVKYVSCSQLSFDAMLLNTSAQFELLNNLEQYTFIEKGLRGGVVVTNKRYVKANNPHMRNYSPHLESSYNLTYFCI